MCISPAFSLGALENTGVCLLYLFKSVWDKHTPFRANRHWNCTGPRSPRQVEIDSWQIKSWQQHQTWVGGWNESQRHFGAGSPHLQLLSWKSLCSLKCHCFASWILRTKSSSYGQHLQDHKKVSMWTTLKCPSGCSPLLRIRIIHAGEWHGSSPLRIVLLNYFCCIFSCWQTCCCALWADSLTHPLLHVDFRFSCTFLCRVVGSWTADSNSVLGVGAKP